MAQAMFTRYHDGMRARRTVMVTECAGRTASSDGGASRDGTPFARAGALGLYYFTWFTRREEMPVRLEARTATGARMELAMADMLSLMIREYASTARWDCSQN